jgi:hypothetical protein
MADSVSSLLTVEIKGGPPKISAAHNVTVEAYERIQVNLPGADDSGKKAVTLNLMPAGSKAKILALTSSRYGDGLTYKVGDKQIPLDGPQLFTGGSVQLLGDVATLTLTNALGAGKDATVTILIGRDVVPPPAQSETPAQPAADTKDQPAADTTKAAQPVAQPVNETKAAQPPTTPTPAADATAAAAKTKQPADANVQPASEQAPKK